MNIKSKKIWLNWKLENETKIPYQPNGRKAKSTDPKTWSTYKEVKAVEKNFSGIGVAFAEGIIGVDFDHCIEDGKIIHPDMEKFVEESNTYCELSPSGTGLHILFHTNDDIKLERNKYKYDDELAVEIYTTGRYFTYTDKPYGKRKSVKTVSESEFIKLLEILGYPFKEKKASAQKQEVKREISDDDKTIVERIINSKSGDKFQKLYSGDISDYDNDDSSADMAMCSYLAFWTQKNREQMRSIWLNSPLGQRKKTQERVDYQDRTIDNAIEKCTEVYEPSEAIAIAKELDLMVNHKGVPYPNTENTIRIIRHDENIHPHFRYNEFFADEESDIMTGKWDKIQKAHILKVMTYIQRTYAGFEKITKQMVEEAITVVSHEQKVNPPKEYFESLKWDGEARLDHWIPKAYGTPDDAYHQAVGANWLKGLVKRVCNAGCKFDYVLVLEGKQGIKKSTSLSILGGDWHVETVLSPENKDFFMILAENAIVEFSEGETLARSEMKKLKAVITMTEDEFRRPYDRSITRVPRHCVFAMTTNQDEYLKDETGNRRWLPVEVLSVDTEYLEENKEQLFAEAYFRVMTLNEPTWEFPEEETQAQQAKRMVEDPYTDKIVDWYLRLEKQDKIEGITIMDVYSQVYAMTKEMNKATGMVIAGILKNVLKLDKRRSQVNGIQANRWYATSETPVKPKELVTLDDW